MDPHSTHRTTARVLRFALRCGDDELVRLLLGSLGGRAGRWTPLAAHTYAQLTVRLGI